MTIENWLKKATKKLEAADIGTARLDCSVLLEDCTGKDRSWLLAHPDVDLEYLLGRTHARDEQGRTLFKNWRSASNEQGPSLFMLANLDRFVSRRAAHEPLAYIREKTEFYGREFFIDHRVLEPRPESETMIELLKEGVSGQGLGFRSSVRRGRTLAQDLIVDVGTGSGALAITAKLEFPAAAVIATDIDPGCLDVAKQNAKKHGIDIQFVEGDLLKPLHPDRYTLTAILANLPYVPDDHKINAAAMKEPKHAIFGGRDGLDVYRKMFVQLRDLKQKPQFIFTESMPPQHEALAEIAKSAGFKLFKTDDFIQAFNSA